MPKNGQKDNNGPSNYKKAYKKYRCTQNLLCDKSNHTLFVLQTISAIQNSTGKLHVFMYNKTRPNIKNIKYYSSSQVLGHHFHNHLCYLNSARRGGSGGCAASQWQLFRSPQQFVY